MVGYIYITENKKNGKKFVGKNYSVSFSKKRLGDAPGLISDIKNQSADDFTVTMIRACETVKECDFVYDAVLEQLNALHDPQYYNCVEEAPKKRPRKKKVVEE